MFLYIVQLLGVAVFACSGCVAASRKPLDLLGIVMVATATAVGGGTVRDVLLDRTPFWIEDPMYLVVVIITAGLASLYARHFPFPHRLLLHADAIGLSIFTIMGTQLAEQEGVSPLIALVMGVITGVVGGAIRDLLCAEIPFIMRSGHLYATAAFAGSGVYLLLLQTGMTGNAAGVIGMITCAAFRWSAILFNIRLPAFQVRYPRD